MGDTPSDGLDTRFDEELVNVAQQRIVGRLIEAWAAFETLELRHFQAAMNKVHGYLWRHFLQDQDLTEDLTHEAFMEAWETLPQKQPELPFLLWVQNIALQVARRYVYKTERETPLNDEVQPSRSGFIWPLSPEEVAQRNPTKAALRVKLVHIMQSLNENQREILRLHFEGLNHREIATMLQIKPESVRQKLWRALKLLRDTWKAEEGQWDLQILSSQPKEGVPELDNTALPQRTTPQPATPKKRGQQRP